MTTLSIKLPPKLVPVFAAPNMRVRGAYGGRGSAKTRSFAKMAAVRGAMWAAEGREGIVLCGRQHMNSLEESSLAEVKAAIASEPWLVQQYDVGEKYVRTRDGRVHFAFRGLWQNLASIKSKARILLCWVDEAEEVSEEAYVELIPTIREEGSELWVTWNPKKEGSATDQRYGPLATLDSDMVVVEINYRDNPWFPEVLERERQRDLRDRPEQYGHIWEGKYATALTGAYFARQLLEAEQQGRIGRVPFDPLLPVLTFHDIGGTSARADYYSIVVAQFVGQTIHVLDHYSAQGQPISEHVAWMRERGYAPRRRKDGSLTKGAHVRLPHDGLQERGPYRSMTWQQAWVDAGFDADTRPNDGGGAAMLRVEAVRRLFPRIWFAEETTRGLRKQLGWYRANIGPDGRDLGPLHDDASHDADAFGLMALEYEAPRKHVEKLAMPAFGAV